MVFNVLEKTSADRHSSTMHPQICVFLFPPLLARMTNNGLATSILGNHNALMKALNANWRESSYLSARVKRHTIIFDQKLEPAPQKVCTNHALILCYVPIIQNKIFFRVRSVQWFIDLQNVSLMLLI